MHVAVLFVRAYQDIMPFFRHFFNTPGKATPGASLLDHKRDCLPLPNLLLYSRPIVNRVVEDGVAVGVALAAFGPDIVGDEVLAVVADDHEHVVPRALAAVVRVTDVTPCERNDDGMAVAEFVLDVVDGWVLEQSCAQSVLLLC